MECNWLLLVGSGRKVRGETAEKKRIDRDRDRDKDQTEIVRDKRERETDHKKK